MKKAITRTLAVIGGLTVIYILLWAVTLLPIWPFPMFEWEYEELPRLLSHDGISR